MCYGMEGKVGVSANYSPYSKDRYLMKLLYKLSCLFVENEGSRREHRQETTLDRCYPFISEKQIVCAIYSR